MYIFDYGCPNPDKSEEGLGASVILLKNRFNKKINQTTRKKFLSKVRSQYMKYDYEYEDLDISICSYCDGVMLNSKEILGFIESSD